LILDGGERLDGSVRKLRISDTPDKTCVVIQSGLGILAVLDRNQQHMLMLYLQERINA
jgi:hypothetical protein